MGSPMGVTWKQNLVVKRGVGKTDLHTKSNPKYKEIYALLDVDYILRADDAPCGAPPFIVDLGGIDPVP
jgi:hypothetical protein